MIPTKPSLRPRILNLATTLISFLFILPAHAEIVEMRLGLKVEVFKVQNGQVSSEVDQVPVQPVSIELLEVGYACKSLNLITYKIHNKATLCIKKLASGEFSIIGDVGSDSSDKPPKVRTTMELTDLALFPKTHIRGSTSERKIFRRCPSRRRAPYPRHSR